MSILPWSSVLLAVLVVSSDGRAAASRLSGLLPISTRVLSENVFLPAREITAHDSERRSTAVAPPPEPVLDYSACAEIDQHKKLRGRIERAVVRLAQEQLTLPMGAGRYLSVRGTRYLFCLEPHYHEPGSGQGPEGWHKGVTVYYAT